MSQTTSTHTPFATENWEAGSEQTTTTACLVKSGQVLVKRTPMGMVAATGEFKAWDPDASDGSEIATRITPFAIDTTGAAKEQQLIKGGLFNPELVQWPAGTTDAQKRAAFVGSPISLQTLR